ncbi:hypothetical protein [Cereibacter sphaeroides]|uniref:hypothetical protein n=1 Tax=Cereibacter sphaeroides TaxID=1063 RepID=UPI0015FB1800|nr:hypothetical protein [Cereibacter sphaeroides]
MTGLALGALSAVVALVVAFLAGRLRASTSSALDAAERALGAEATRRQVDDEIADDTDLAARARRVGLVRPRD